VFHRRGGLPVLPDPGFYIRHAFPPFLAYCAYGGIPFKVVRKNDRLETVAGRIPCRPAYRRGFESCGGALPESTVLAVRPWPSGYGHLQGDQRPYGIPAGISLLIGGWTMPEIDTPQDVACRWGGEEFMCGTRTNTGNRPGGRGSVYASP
jgi:hypothetical protein